MPPQPVLVRATPNVRGDTHEKISTGQADSKFGFAMDQVAGAVERIRGITGLALEGVHAHIGSQLFDLEPFRREVAQLAGLRELAGGDGFPTWDLGGGLGVAYTAGQRPPAIEEYVGALVQAAREHLGDHRRAADRARPRAHRERRGDAVHRAERQAQRLHLGGGGRRHVRQPAPDAVRGACTKRTSPTAPAATPPACSPASTASRAT